jgi:hypothetical protein
LAGDSSTAVSTFSSPRPSDSFCAATVKTTAENGYGIGCRHRLSLEEKSI